MSGYEATVLTMILVITFFPKLTESVEMNNFEEVRSFKDKVVTSPPLWTRKSEDSIDCARQCSRDVLCVSFFYNKLTKLCRAQEFLLYPIYPTQEVGSKYYAYLNDCKDAVSLIPPSLVENSEFVCDRYTDGGKWLVFQRRKDGSVNFLTVWNDYKKGFGSPSTEFWLGNDILHNLTNQKPFELRIDMMDWDLVTAYAVYTTFNVASEDQYYSLEVANFTGDQGDSFSVQSGANFSTIDNDNDQSASGGNCAETFTGAWWYYTCHESNLNGLYNNYEYGKGIIWMSWKGFTVSLKSTEMKIRPL